MITQLKRQSDAYYNEALDALKDNNITFATKRLEEAVELYARDQDTLNLLGICCYLQCAFSKAQEAWRRSLDVCSEDNQASQYIAFLNTDEFNEVLTSYNEGLRLAKEGNYSEGMTLIKDVIHKMPDWIEPYSVLALILIQTQKLSQAYKLMCEAVSRDHGNGLYRAYLSQLQQAVNEIKEKQIPIERRRATRHKLWAVSILGGVGILYGVSQYNAYHLEQRTQIDKLHWQLAQSIEEKESLAQDKRVLQQTLTIKQDEIVTLETSLQQQLDKEEMLATQEPQYIDKDKSEIQWLYAAMAVYRGQRYEEAAKRLEDLVNYGTDEGIVNEALYFLANAYRMQGNNKKASIYYEQYIEDYVESHYYDDAVYEYGMMLYQQGDSASAKKVLQTLQQDLKNSIFNNSKVDYILKQ